MAAARSRPKAVASSCRVFPMRCGASNSTRVRGSRASRASAALRSPARAGRKPSNTKRSVGSPATASAAVTAEGPGIVRTSIPAAAAARTSTKPGSETRGVPASLTSASTAPFFSRSRSASTRLLGAALLFAALSACAHFPPARFPGATPGAATQAPAGERRAEAIALENAARQAPPGEQVQLQLRAARAWLQAGRAGEAQRVLGALSTGLTPVQNIERRVLDADIELASGRAQQAWLKMSAIPEPTGTPLAPQYFDSRMRIALAAARPVEGVRAEMDAERITADGAARSAQYARSEEHTSELQ